MAKPSSKSNIQAIENSNNSIQIQENTGEINRNQVDKISNDTFRSLKSLETGKPIEELPNNIYGYADAIDIWDFVASGNKSKLKLSSRKYKDFEIQKYNNKIFVIAFISDESYSRIGKVNEKNPSELVLFPQEQEDFKNIVSILLDSISSIRHRRVDISDEESVSVLDITVSNIFDNAIAHLKN